jgi:formate-dependent nitrite reductase cytochrome c552 subunit
MPYALVPLALLLAAPPGLAGDERHPAVGADVAPDACITCHAERTPRIVKEWESGQHGLVLVKCFVCHGSTGKDFTEHAGVARCGACHDAEVASLAPVRAKFGAKAKAADCFSCHEPHTLAAREGGESPHGAQAR